MSNDATELCAKLAISLPRSLMKQMEKLRKDSGESRSLFIRRAIRHLIESQAKKRKIQQYVDGYSRNPETQEEVKAAEAAATYLLAEEPWE